MSTISASTTSTTAYKVTADTTGALVLQTGATPTTALTIDASQNITTANRFAKASMPAGSVLQVINVTYATATSNSTSTYADTGLTATITPTSSSSKILVLVSQNGCRKQTNDTYISLKVLRTSTTIITPVTAAAYTASAATNDIGSVSCEFLDSPATTSATTYKTQFASGNNNAQVSVQVGNDGSTITLMEIAV
jgi:hypothetical protein